MLIFNVIKPALKLVRDYYFDRNKKLKFLYFMEKKFP